jgi:hypothetical protein
MDTDCQPTFGATRNSASFISGFAWTFFAAVIIYILSFGPITRLTSDVLGAGFRTTRRAAFPGWCRWTHVVYRPLLAVQGGQAGRLPSRIVWWYVDLWMR